MQELTLVLQGLLPTEWYTTILSLLGIIGGICALLCTLFPAPSATSSSWYTLLYKIINVLGANFGKAKNADDSEVIKFR